ncbi:MAG: hypothetical protein V7609_3427 [Verrucomicrobiota bacterium]
MFWEWEVEFAWFLCGCLVGCEGRRKEANAKIWGNPRKLSGAVTQEQYQPEDRSRNRKWRQLRRAAAFSSPSISSNARISFGFRNRAARPGPPHQAEDVVAADHFSLSHSSGSMLACLITRFTSDQIQIAAMRVGNGHRVSSVAHHTVTLARFRTCPTKKAHSPNQLPPANRLRHIPVSD